MTGVRGRVVDAGGGWVHIVLDRDTESYPSGDVLIYEFTNDTPITFVPEPLIARTLRLLRETADALDELPAEIRDVGMVFDICRLSGDRLRARAEAIEDRARSALAALAPYGEWLATHENDHQP